MRSFLTRVAEFILLATLLFLMGWFSAQLFAQAVAERLPV